MYVFEIVRLNGVLLYEALGTRLDFSTAYHLQFDGQSKGNWEEHLPLAKFAYNNSYQFSIQMTPYEALYGRKCRSPLCWTELGERQILGPELVSEAENIVKLIRDRLKATSNQHKSYTDLKRKDIEYSAGDQVFLKVSLCKKVLRFGRKGNAGRGNRGEIRFDLREGTSSDFLEWNVKVLRRKTVPLVKITVLRKPPRNLKIRYVNNIRICLNQVLECLRCFYVQSSSDGYMCASHLSYPAMWEAVWQTMYLSDFEFVDTRANHMSMEEAVYG
ncbi:reverse transcriptase [Gossypium australe]|uniref:Reverse transcriptase n=1 Tax=Gossypium australe TaxID=47621 RepID=A0A5B6WI07_9ROSI|nr:reverse transcriptase [Gossypium australe]